MTILNTPAQDAEAAYQRLWWLTLTRGIFAIVLGLAAMFWPNITISVLFMLFGFFTIVDGVIALGIGLFGGRSAWGWTAFQGLLGIVVGVLVLRYPQTVANLVVVIIALWALAMGLFQIVISMRLRDTNNWIWVLISGLITTALGIYFLINPDTGTKVLAIVLGIFALLTGVVLVFGAFKLKKYQSELVSLLTQ